MACCVGIYFTTPCIYCLKYILLCSMHGHCEVRDVYACMNRYYIYTIYIYICVCIYILLDDVYIFFVRKILAQLLFPCFWFWFWFSFSFFFYFNVQAYVRCHEINDTQKAFKNPPQPRQLHHHPRSSSSGCDA